MAITNKVDELKTESDERISFLATIPYSAVDNHIENLFSNLNSGQKRFLKKLTKVTLFLFKEFNRRH